MTPSACSKCIVIPERCGWARRCGSGLRSIRHSSDVPVVPEDRVRPPIEIAGPIGAANVALGVLGSIGVGVLLNKKMSPLTLGLTAVALVGACGSLIFTPNIGVALSTLMFLVCCIGAGAAIGLGFAMVPVVAPSPQPMGQREPCAINWSTSGDP